MKLLSSVLLGVGLLATSWAQALTIAPYSADALAAAQSTNAPVALHFHAPWCSTCKAQTKALELLKADPKLNITVLVADYDSETELKKALKVRGQSTLVVYRGKTETGRSVGVTAPEGLRTVLETAQ